MKTKPVKLFQICACDFNLFGLDGEGRPWIWSPQGRWELMESPQEIIPEPKKDPLNSLPESDE